jgi:hypothetical protein
VTSAYLETIRNPLTLARNHVMAADANLTGLVAKLAAGDVVSVETIRSAVARCDHARQDMDRAIYAALDVEFVNGRRLAAFDSDDMKDALLTRLGRNELPRRADDEERRLIPADCLEPRLPAVGSFY